MKLKIFQILYIQAAVLAYTCGKIMISMFFGTLRQQEYDVSFCLLLSILKLVNLVLNVENV